MFPHTTKLMLSGYQETFSVNRENPVLATLMKTGDTKKITEINLLCEP